jgi:hypothetical protein
MSNIYTRSIFASRHLTEMLEPAFHWPYRVWNTRVREKELEKMYLFVFVSNLKRYSANCFEKFRDWLKGLS